MPLTPEAVSNKRFTPVRLREGYDMGEVDQFLDEVEAELARLTRDNNDLRSKVTSAQKTGASTATAATSTTAPAAAEDEPAQDKGPVTDRTAEAEPETAPAAPSETLKVHTVADASSAAVRLLEIATRNADELVTEAKNDADQTLGEARTNAERLESESKSRAEKVEADARSRSEMLESETAERRTQLFGDLDKEKEKLNVEVENLRSFEREYRSRLKSYFSEQLAALDGDGEAGTLNSNDHQPTRMEALLGDEEQSPNT